jgi:hypothetical protein
MALSRITCHCPLKSKGFNYYNHIFLYCLDNSPRVRLNKLPLGPEAIYGTISDDQALSPPPPPPLDTMYGTVTENYPRTPQLVQLQNGTTHNRFFTKQYVTVHGLRIGYVLYMTLPDTVCTQSQGLFPSI